MQQQFITDTQLAERYNVHRTTVWRWVSAGRIPPPVRMSGGFSRWPLDEIEQIEADQKAEREAEQKRRAAAHQAELRNSAGAGRQGQAA